MRISFDLDDTLICYRDGALLEPAPPWYRRWMTSGEPLRRGAVALIRELQALGHDVWIYTTSHRSPRAIRRWLGAYGVRIQGVINQDEHDRHLLRSPHDHPPSKHPAAFDIALHVDDSEGVRVEGERCGFTVIVVAPLDPEWATTVRRAAAARGT